MHLGLLQQPPAQLSRKTAALIKKPHFSTASAKRGWVFATSSYRGEQVHITLANSNFPASSTWTSDGVPELCMGEVTDVMALTDLVVNHASSISVGSASQQVPST